MLSEQMDVSISNAIHHCLSTKTEVDTKFDPMSEYIRYLLLKINKDNYEDIKLSFFRLPIRNLEDKIIIKFHELVFQFSNEQVQ